LGDLAQRLAKVKPYQSKIRDKVHLKKFLKDIKAVDDNW